MARVEQLREAARNLNASNPTRPQRDYGFGKDELEKVIKEEMAHRGDQNFGITKKCGFTNGSKSVKLELMVFLRNLLEDAQGGQPEIIIPGDHVCYFGRNSQRPGIVQKVWTNDGKKGNKWGAVGTLWRQVKLDVSVQLPPGIKRTQWAKQSIDPSTRTEKKMYRLQKVEEIRDLDDFLEDDLPGDDDASTFTGPSDGSIAMSEASTRAAEAAYAYSQHTQRLIDTLQRVPEDEMLEEEDIIQERSKPESNSATLSNLQSARASNSQPASVSSSQPASQTGSTELPPDNKSFPSLKIVLMITALLVIILVGVLGNMATASNSLVIRSWAAPDVKVQDAPLSPELFQLLSGDEASETPLLDTPSDEIDENPSAEARKKEAAAEVERILACRQVSEILGSGTSREMKDNFKRIVLLLHPHKGLVSGGDKNADLALRLTYKAKSIMLSSKNSL